MRNPVSMAVVGLGIVGLSVATTIGQKKTVIGYDINSQRITELRNQNDRNGLCDAKVLADSKIDFTFNQEDLKKANFYIISVQTSTSDQHEPNLLAIKEATRQVAGYLSPGDVVVYESTVYPGATEEVLIPALESVSGLKEGRDFYVGFSPERVNPGDAQHQIMNQQKIVAAQHPEALKRISEIYQEYLAHDIVPVDHIAVAEAAKLIENSQRDINIAFMNQMALVFHRLGIDTDAVLQAAGTKWNFQHYHPGLVGGACVPMATDFLIHCAKKRGYIPHVLMEARELNEHFHETLIEQVCSEYPELGRNCSEINVAVLGVTFKEDVNDIRDSRALNLVKSMSHKDYQIAIHDPWAENVLDETGKPFPIIDFANDMGKWDMVVIAVGHSFYEQPEVKKRITKLVKDNGILIDLHDIYKLSELSEVNFRYWRL